MKKIITLSLAVLLLCCCLAGCGGSNVDLTGRWESVFYYDSESIEAELKAWDFYDEEIALLDTGSVGICEVLELNADMTYTITCDAAKTMEMTREFYNNAFTIFYENREQLQSLYEEDFVSMTEDEFKLYYANLYGASSFDSLMYMLAGTLDDYAYLEEDAEVGTYRISINRIYFTIDGTSEEEYVSFRTGDDGSLTLDYTDTTVTYTKAE